MSDEQNESLGCLKLRIELLNHAIRVACQRGDTRIYHRQKPEVPSVIEQQNTLVAMYRKRLAEERKRNGEPEPEPVVVALNPASLLGRARSVRRDPNG